MLVAEHILNKKMFVWTWIVSTGIVNGLLIGSFLLENLLVTAKHDQKPVIY